LIAAVVLVAAVIAIPPADGISGFHGSSGPPGGTRSAAASIVVTWRRRMVCLTLIQTQRFNVRCAHMSAGGRFISPSMSTVLMNRSLTESLGILKGTQLRFSMHQEWWLPRLILCFAIGAPRQPDLSSNILSSAFHDSPVNLRPPIASKRTAFSG